MAVEYPILAFIASIMFATVILSTLYLYIYVVSEINRIPVLSGYAEIRVIFSDAVVQVKIIHERGEPVKLLRIDLYTEIGAISCEPLLIRCITPREGIIAVIKYVNIGEDGTVLPGSVGYMLINISSTQAVRLFYPDKDYGIIILFDKGILALKASVLYVLT